MFKVGIRFYAAPRHNAVGGADGCGAAEGCSDSELIVPFQIGTVNDAKNVPAVVLPVFIHKLICDPLHLIREALCSRNAKMIFQGLGNHILVSLLIDPKVWFPRLLSANGVGNVKHIAQLGMIRKWIDQGNAFGTSPDVASHLSVPKVIIRTGGGFRPLGVDHQLLMVRILVKPGGGGQKVRPALIAGGDLPGGTVCQLYVKVRFFGHKSFLLIRQKRVRTLRTRF